MLPWTSDDTLAPPAAEAARSLLRTATTLALHLQEVPGLVVVGGHADDEQGRLLVPTSADCRVLAATGGRTAPVARAELTDVAPLPVRSRRRGRLDLVGPLEEVPADDAAAAWARATGGCELAPGRRLLRLAPCRVQVQRAAEEALSVPVASYAAARPDPVADLEAELLWHLHAGHPDQVLQLADLLPRRLSRGARRVVPVRLERRALVLRVERSDGDVDVPLALACAAAEEPRQVLAALRALLDSCPRRARRG